MDEEDTLIPGCHLLDAEMISLIRHVLFFNGTDTSRFH
jgi:hypothetical protein